jgi:hypothetical protein
VSHAIFFPSGGFLDSRMLSSLIDDADKTKSRESDPKPSMNAPDPLDPLADEPKWPAWKVTLAVILFCGAFWAGVVYLGMKLFGG